MAFKSLYIGNMAYRTQESTLRSAFEAFGPLGEIRIIGDKGFAFIEVPEEQMQAAIDAMNGQAIDGRPLVVNEARPRTERSDRGGFGGGGRGGYGNGGGRSGGGYGGGRDGGYGRDRY